MIKAAHEEQSEVVCHDGICEPQLSEAQRIKVCRDAYDTWKSEHQKTYFFSSFFSLSLFKKTAFTICQNLLESKNCSPEIDQTSALISFFKK